MLYFTGQNTISLVQRQVVTGTRSTYTTVTGLAGTGYLKPLSEEQSSLNNMQYGQAYMLITETDFTLAVGDRVTVDSVVYTVRGLANHNRGGLTAYKRYLLTLPSA